MNDKTAEYLAEYNQDAVLWIMIERLTGVDKLDEMLSIGLVDGILIGPHDLSVSCGVAVQYEHPRFNKLVDNVIGVCNEHSVGVGMHVGWGDLEYELRMM